MKTNTGPPFLLSSKESDQCLQSSKFANSSHTPVRFNRCDLSNQHQQWTWAGDQRLLNHVTKQCLSYSQSRGLISKNCDVTDADEEWEAEDWSLLHGGSNDYLRSSGDFLLTPDPERSQWQAKVDVGSGKLEAMEGEFFKSKLFSSFLFKIIIFWCFSM